MIIYEVNDHRSKTENIKTWNAQRHNNGIYFGFKIAVFLCAFMHDDFKNSI